MKDLALNYFKTQPDYCFTVAVKVRDVITKLWLDGCELRKIAMDILNSDLGKQSVCHYKQYAASIPVAEAVADGATRSIYMGFLAYIIEIYYDLQNNFDYSNCSACVQEIYDNPNFHMA